MIISQCTNFDRLGRHENLRNEIAQDPSSENQL